MTKPAYKWELLGWLWLAFFFNQADRQLFNVALPLIRADLHLSDAQVGIVASLFILAIGVFIPVAGFVGDLYSRKRVIVASLAFWSLATLLTGSSTTLLHLILLRSLAVGGGEAFYAPSANALIGQFHIQTRALALSVHQSSLYAGLILSGALGGYLAQQFGWRHAFYGFGGAGVLLAALIGWRLHPTPVLLSPLGRQPVGVLLQNALRMLFGNPSALLLGLAFLCLVFVNVGYQTWTPTFLHEKFGLSIADAGFSSMFYHHIAAFVGVMAGGVFSDRVARRVPRYRLLVQASGLLLGFPAIWLMGQSATSGETYLWMAVSGLFRGVYEANFYTTLFEVVVPHLRASVAGLVSMAAFIAGAIAPFLLGYLKPSLGLSDGLSWLCLPYLVGAMSVLLAYRYFFNRNRIANP